MKLAIVTTWGDKKSAFYSNKDGILKMFHVLRERDKWDVRMFRRHPEQTFVWEHDFVEAHVSPDPAKAALAWKPDAILFFGDFSRPELGQLEHCGIPMAICYSGGRFTTYSHIPKVIFVESKSYISWMQTIPQIKGKIIQAFGTNTELFKPMPQQPKYFDALFPATFASWKRHNLFVEAMGPRGVCCGWWQDHEMDIIQNIIQKNVGVLHHQPAESMALLFNMARTVVITSHDTGGSQRTVLEAMASNVPLIVMADSTMTSEYVRESNAAGFWAGEIVEPNAPAIRSAVDGIIAVGQGNPSASVASNAREWIMQNYSEFIYADKVKAGIESILG